MDIILFDYYKLKYNDDVNFYWMDKNRTFILQKKDYIKEDYNAVHNLKAHLDGEYSLEFKPNLKQIKFGIRINGKILLDISLQYGHFISLICSLVVSNILFRLFCLHSS